MEKHILKRNKKRKMRVMRIRKHIKGTAEKPRLSVAKSNKHLAVQLINDDQGMTLASANTMQKEFKKHGKGKEGAKQLGTKIAELAKEQKIQKIVFDRGRLKFHGLIAELAKSAREAGLQF